MCVTLHNDFSLFQLQLDASPSNNFANVRDLIIVEELGIEVTQVLLLQVMMKIIITMEVMAMEVMAMR